MIHNPLIVRATAVWVRESRDGTVRSRYLSRAAEQRSGHTEPTQQSTVGQHSSHCTNNGGRAAPEAEQPLTNNGGRAAQRSRGPLHCTNNGGRAAQGAGSHCTAQTMAEKKRALLFFLVSSSLEAENVRIPEFHGIRTAAAVQQ